MLALTLPFGTLMSLGVVREGNVMSWGLEEPLDYIMRVLGFLQEIIQKSVRVKGKQVYLERYSFPRQNLDHFRK